MSYVRLCRYVIEVDPLTVCALDYTLCAKDHTVGIILGECLENRVYTFNSKLLGSLTAKAGEHLVSVVMVTVIVTSTRAMLTVFVVVVVMLVLVTMALFTVVMLVIVTVTLFIVVMLVLVAMALFIVVMLVLVAVTLLIVVVIVLVAMALFIVVMMLVLVTVALLTVVVMLVLVTVTLLIVVVMLVIVTVALFTVMVMLVIVAMALLTVMVMVVMVVLMLLLKSLKRRIKSILLLHSGEDILAVELVPRSGYNGCCSVVLSDKLNCAFNLLSLGNVGMRKNYRRCVSDLIVIELAKVLHIHLALIYVCNGGEAVKLSVLCLNRLYRFDYVGELTYSAGLDDNSIGMEFVKHLFKRL